MAAVSSPSPRLRLPRSRPSSPLVPHRTDDDGDARGLHSHSSSSATNGLLASPSPCKLRPGDHRVNRQQPANDDEFSDITGSLRPVQEYHNAFTNVGPSSSSPTKSAPSTPSQFSSFASASRSFLSHNRQQSIPNLLPTITTSIGNLSRAISPERSRTVRRRPKPAYDSDSSVDTVDDSDDYSSDEEDRIMATYTGGGTRIKRPTGYTTYKKASTNNGAAENSRSRSPGTANAPTTLSGWLSRSATVKGRSPDRSSVASSSRASTPEPSGFTLRPPGGGTPGTSGLQRTMSFASNSSATPRSTAGSRPSVSPSRFSQLASSMSATLTRLKQQPTSPRPMSAGLEHDEFYNLNVDAALFPSGQPSDHDAFSPSAFKNLEANARGTLMNLLDGYRHRTVDLKEVLAEKSVRDEELEEAETRAKHLKMQLEGMARKAAEQEQEMKVLRAELAAEKKSRAQERAMMMAGMPATATGLREEDQATTATISEDLGAEEAQRQQMRRRLRKSDGSYGDTDEGDEESTSSALDEDEDEASMFSRSRSPTIAPSVSNDSMLDAPGAGHSISHPRVAALGASSKQQSGKTLTTSSGGQHQPLNTFQKLVRNMTASVKDEDQDAGCRNCQGQDVSFAWNTVSILRDENKELKQRVGQLEVAVETALDAVNGIGMD